MRKYVIIIFILIMIKFLFFFPANREVNQKLDLIQAEIAKKGYNNYWFVISGKRFNWYNKILSNSDKKSFHLTGKAIDIYVFDINGDYKFDSVDIEIFESANHIVELKHPELAGAYGTYTTKGYFTKHMIHFDTRGKKHRYNY